MSTRQLLNMTFGAFALLLLAAIGIVFSAASNNDSQGAQIDLALGQQALIQDMTRQTAQLSDAEDRAEVDAARQRLAGTIVKFDRNLAALIHGGEGIDASGQNITVERTHDDTAQLALADAADVWLETGLPLSDLTAGEFSVYSAAGQIAVQNLQGNSVELMQHMGATANAMRMGVHVRSSIARFARWAAVGLAILVVGFGYYRRKILAAESKTTAPTEAPAPTPQARLFGNQPAPVSQSLSQPMGQPASERPRQAFASPVNFESVNASVDQMSVDMNTIAGSTDKMRLAIDSVGNALQGMFYSLTEMAQDTAEGHKIVRNANNAASFSADTAGDLAASAREMSAVVARVTQLAMSTKSVAAQIDGDALHTGKTGEAFTSVVAGEVQGLAHQTNEATHQIEQTVAEILATARQYEEAIGLIIKNVSAINKVSQDLGDLMTSPPPRVEQGAPEELPNVAESSSAAGPTLAAAMPPKEPVTDEVPEIDDMFSPEVEQDISVEDAAMETATAIEDVAQEAKEIADVVVESEEKESRQVESPEEPVDEVFMLGQTTKKPDALNIPALPTSEPASESPAVESPVESAEDAVFVLGSNKASPAPAEPEPVTVPAKEPQAEETQATGSSGNIFMLNKPE
ncbi:MAG: hypothetical protein ACI9UK_000856 [Candidatus Krumholzibacteriia bacterium]|jgi:hypothetical protein